MEIKLIVSAEIIATLKLFAPDNDVRYYLNGIALEIGARESRLVATDGVILGCFRVVSEQPEVSDPLADIIIPKALLKPIGHRGMVEIAIGAPVLKRDNKGEQVPSNSRPVTLTYNGVSVSGETIDGKFIRYRDVIPSKTSGQPAQFDAQLIGTLTKAWSIIHGSKDIGHVGIGFNGTGPALIDLGNENFTGIIMPRVIPAPTEPPPWYSDSLRVAVDSAGGLV